MEGWVRNNSIACMPHCRKEAGYGVYSRVSISKETKLGGIVRLWGAIVVVFILSYISEPVTVPLNHGLSRYLE